MFIAYGHHVFAVTCCNSLIREAVVVANADMACGERLGRICKAFPGRGISVDFIQ